VRLDHNHTLAVVEGRAAYADRQGIVVVVVVAEELATGAQVAVASRVDRQEGAAGVGIGNVAPVHMRGEEREMRVVDRQEWGIVVVVVVVGVQVVEHTVVIGSEEI